MRLHHLSYSLDLFVDTGKSSNNDDNDDDGTRLTTFTESKEAAVITVLLATVSLNVALHFTLNAITVKRTTGQSNGNFVRRRHGAFAIVFGADVNASTSFFLGVRGLVGTFHDVGPSTKLVLASLALIEFIYCIYVVSIRALCKSRGLSIELDPLVHGNEVGSLDMLDVVEVADWIVGITRHTRIQIRGEGSKNSTTEKLLELFTKKNQINQLQARTLPCLIQARGSHPR